MSEQPFCWFAVGDSPVAGRPDKAFTPEQGAEAYAYLEAMTEAGFENVSLEVVRSTMHFKVPTGWRPLCVGEVIRAGDMWLRPGAEWQAVNSTGGRWNPMGFWPCVRVANT